MRYSKGINTSMMLNEALANKEFLYELNKGETEVSVWIAPNGAVYWYVDQVASTEQGVAEVLARWAVEGMV